jgi:hypothetical protein
LTSIFSIQKDITILEQAIAIKKQAAQDILKKSFPKKAKTDFQDPLLLMQSYVKQASKNRGSRQQKKELKDYSDIKAMDVLFELSNNISDTIHIDLSRLILNNDQLIISGLTNNYNNVDKIKVSIEKSYLFKQVSISSAEANKTGDGILFKFIIDI